MGKYGSSQKFEEDPRYRQCAREALIGLGLGVANLIWWFAWGYGLGSKPPEEYSYILGFPAWFFMSCVAGALLFTFLAAYVAVKYVKDTPLGEFEEIEETKEKRRCGADVGNQI